MTIWAKILLYGQKKRKFWLANGLTKKELNKKQTNKSVTVSISKSKKFKETQT